MSRRLTDADLAEILRRQGKEVDFKYRANPRPRVGPSESQIQQAVIRWWAVACKQHGIPEHLLMAIPLQAARSPQNGARMKAEGARKGTPDLFLAVPCYGNHGLWIEMKKPDGKVSEEQAGMMISLRMQMYHVSICYSFDEAVNAITEYLRLP